MLKRIILLFFINFIFPQNIYHEPIDNIQNGNPIEIEIFTDLQGQEIISYNLFYKNNNQEAYFRMPLNSEDNIYYSAIIPEDFINSDIIYYYILLETESNAISIPNISPDINPMHINIINMKDDIDYLYPLNLNNSFNIISPLPNEKLLLKDLMVAVSYYELDNLDHTSVQVFLNDKEISDRAIIKDNYLILYPPRLSNGSHDLKILFKDNVGNYFEPLQWSFIIIDDDRKNFEYSGQIWNDYIDNNIDDLKTYVNTSNIHFSGSTEWIDFTLKLKKSSLENPLEQPKDRYSLLLKNKVIDLNFGDFYPQFNNLVLNGNRVRGVGLDFHLKFFQLNLISGQLNEAIQGNPSQNLNIALSEEYDENLQNDINLLTISRDNYTFENEITGVRLGIGNRDKFNWGLNFVKVKDNINSVNKYIEGAIITLDELTAKYDSDEYIDYDNDNFFDNGNDILYNDNDEHINGIDNQFDDIVDIVENSKFITYEKITVTTGTCYDDECPECIDGCPIKQNTWNIEIIYDDDFEEILNTSFPDDVDQIKYLDNQWDGAKPKDNFVFGSDVKLNFNRVTINSSIGISLVNENIWNPIITLEEFDTYADDYEDCYYGRTYSSEFLDNGFSWINCQLLQDNAIINNSLSEVYIEEEGIALEDIPNPEDFEEIFHYNFDSVPTIPFYGLLQRQADGEDIKFMDILNSPEVAYDFNIQLKYPVHNMQFGIKKIGPSFTSLANPYLQNDTQEKFIIDRMRLFNNKMFLSLSWRSIQNGLLEQSSTSSTGKYDINLSFYPQKRFPHITLNYGIYTKESGEILSFDSENENDEVIDTRLHTETTNYNIYINYGFKLFEINHNLGLSLYQSDKIDLLFDELISSIDDYVSPCSNSNNYNFTLKSYINNKWNTDVYISNSSFDFSKQNTISYQEQDISTIRMGFNFSNSKVIDKMGAWLDYSEGIGSSDYSQYGIKLLLDLNLYKNLIMNINLRHYYKNVNVNTSSSDSDYQNSIIRASLSYKF